MKICRFDENRLGVVKGTDVLDVTQALDVLPPLRWPVPHGDLFMTHFDAIRARIAGLVTTAPRVPLASVKLLSPIANPSKIIGAPVNYLDHLEESLADPNIRHTHNIKRIGEWGLFLKAGTSLVGPSEGVAQRFRDRRNDHEAELAVVIGKRGSEIAHADAMSYIAGYCIGLDMTVRGPQFQCFRKSVDTYSVLGPWLTTADEIADPGKINFFLTVNGEPRQRSNTRFLDYDVPRLIEFASSYYTLYPGDVIMTGTPAGVGPVVPGDIIHVAFDGLGAMDVAVRAA